MAVGSISVRSATQAEEQLALRHHLIVEIGGGLGPRQRGAPSLEGDLETQAIARHHLAAELRVVDAAQIDARVGRTLLALEQKDRGHLRQRLEHQHAGHQRGAGEMSLKELLVDGDVLERQPGAGPTSCSVIVSTSIDGYR